MSFYIYSLVTPFWQAAEFIEEIASDVFYRLLVYLKMKLRLLKCVDLGVCIFIKINFNF